MPRAELSFRLMKIDPAWADGLVAVVLDHDGFAQKQPDRHRKNRRTDRVYDVGISNQTTKFQETGPPDHSKSEGRIIECASRSLRHDGNVVRLSRRPVRGSGPFGETICEYRGDGLHAADRWCKNVCVDKDIHAFSDCLVRCLDEIVGNRVNGHFVIPAIQRAGSSVAPVSTPQCTVFYSGELRLRLN